MIVIPQHPALLHDHKTPRQRVRGAVRIPARLLAGMQPLRHEFFPQNGTASPPVGLRVPPPPSRIGRRNGSTARCPQVGHMEDSPSLQRVARPRRGFF